MGQIIYQSHWVILTIRWDNPREPVAQLLAHSKHSLNCSFNYSFISSEKRRRFENMDLELANSHVLISIVLWA